MRKRRTTVVAAGIALALGLTACGGDSNDNSDDNGNKSVDVAYDAGNKGVVNPSDKTGGTLRYALTDEPDSMDPGDTYYAFNWDFTRNYARPLVSFASKVGKEGLKATPDLAETLGVASDGNKTWTYKLKAGLKYEDGTPITSKDVKYAVARSNYGGVLINGPKYFAQYLDAGDYAGPYKDKNLDNFKGIETPDDQTIVFKLKQPFAEFDYLADQPADGTRAAGQGHRPEVPGAPALDRALQVRELPGRPEVHPRQERPVGRQDRPAAQAARRQDRDRP